MKLNQRKATELKELLKKKEVSSLEVVSSVFKEIKSKDKDINSFITLIEEDAKKSAEKIDQKIARGENLGSLAGL